MGRDVGRYWCKKRGGWNKGQHIDGIPHEDQLSYREVVFYIPRYGREIGCKVGKIKKSVWAVILLLNYYCYSTFCTTIRKCEVMQNKLTKICRMLFQMYFPLTHVQEWRTGRTWLTRRCFDPVVSRCKWKSVSCTFSSISFFLKSSVKHCLQNLKPVSNSISCGDQT